MHGPPLTTSAYDPTTRAQSMQWKWGTTSVRHALPERRYGNGDPAAVDLHAGCPWHTRHVLGNRPGKPLAPHERLHPRGVGARAER
eukprot:2775963-Heterocapsa_arctica.AAC.1